MKKFLALLFLTCFAYMGIAQDKNVKDQNLLDQASKIAKDLKLDKRTEKLVYNVLDHVKRRIEDVPMGHKEYKKLLGYIDQERFDMMRVILTPDQFKQYDKLFSKEAADKIEEKVAANQDYVKKHGELIPSKEDLDGPIDIDAEAQAKAEAEAKAKAEAEAGTQTKTEEKSE